MSNMKNEETQPNPVSSPKETTQPVKTGRQIFKDPKPAKDTPENLKNTGETADTLTRKSKRGADAPVVTLPADAVEEIREDLVNGGQPKKARRGKWVWLGILLLLVISAAGAGIGYASALETRRNLETTQRLEIATVQFLKAEQEFAAGDLAIARERLEYILTIYPAYPGLSEKLTEVMLAQAVANPDIVAAPSTTEVANTPVPTKNTTVLSELFAQAQNQYKNREWPNLLDTVGQLRNLDPGYQAIAVDGFYYAALRFNGIAMINAGFLEKGLYYFSMAEQLAPLDVDAEGTRARAQMYLIASSWFGVNWSKAAEAFYTVYQQYPSMVDLSGMTAKQRYVRTLEGVGDDLQLEYKYCEAVGQYESAAGILQSDQLLTKLNQAREFCANPPATPTPTLDPNAPIETPTPTDAPG